MLFDCRERATSCPELNLRTNLNSFWFLKKNDEKKNAKAKLAECHFLHYEKNNHFLTLKMITIASNLRPNRPVDASSCSLAAPTGSGIPHQTTTTSSCTLSSGEQMNKF